MTDEDEIKTMFYLFFTSRRIFRNSIFSHRTPFAHVQNVFGDRIGHGPLTEPWYSAAEPTDGCTART